MRNRARARLLLTLVRARDLLTRQHGSHPPKEEMSTHGLFVALAVVATSTIGSLTVTAGSATRSTKLSFPRQRGPGSRGPSKRIPFPPSWSEPSRQLPNWRRHVPLIQMTLNARSCMNARNNGWSSSRVREQRRLTCKRNSRPLAKSATRNGSMRNQWMRKCVRPKSPNACIVNSQKLTINTGNWSDGTERRQSSLRVSSSGLCRRRRCTKRCRFGKNCGEFKRKLVEMRPRREQFEAQSKPIDDEDDADMGDGLGLPDNIEQVERGFCEIQKKRERMLRMSDDAKASQD